MVQVLRSTLAHHDLKLLAAAAFLCAVSTAAALFLYSKTPAAPERRRRGWLAMTGFVAGSGAWATHFVAMLAYRSGAPDGYDVLGTVSSLVVAICAATIGMAIGSRTGPSALRSGFPALGGLVVGLGVAVMHYTGMAGYRVEGMMRWDLGGVAASVIVAVAFAMAAFQIAPPGARLRARVTGGLLLAVGILGAHLTGMAAMTVTPDVRIVVPPGVSDVAVTIAVMVVMTLIVMAAVGGVAFESAGANGNLKRLRQALDAMREGVAFYDPSDRLIAWNAPYAGFCRVAGTPLFVGLPFARLRDSVVSHGGVAEPAGRHAASIAGNGRSNGPQGDIRPTLDGKWVRIVDRSTPDGGFVTTIVDLTELKEAEMTMTLARDSERSLSLRLKAVSQRQEVIFDSVRDAIFLINPANTSFVEVNQSAARMFGYLQEELVGLSITDISSGVAPYDRTGAIEALAQAGKGGADIFEWHGKRKDGSLFWVEASVRFAVLDAETLALAVLRDITERKQGRHELENSEARLKAVLETTADGIVLLDQQTGKIALANPAFCSLSGYHADEIASLTLKDLQPVDAPPQVAAFLEGQLRGERTGSVSNVPVKRKDGSVVYVDISSAAMLFDGRGYFLGCFHDVTERRRTEERITRMARHDELTGLANRRQFVEALDLEIARSLRGGEGFAVLYLDLDHFKDVNDTLGHPVGDLLLKEVAERLRGCVRAVDTVARFGGDEFAVIVTDVHEMDAGPPGEPGWAGVVDPVAAHAAAVAGGVADKILSSVAAPYRLNGNEVRSGASVGIAVFGADSPDAEAMLSHADVALYRAKSEGRGRGRFFTDAMDAEVRARVDMAHQLREAIAGEQFYLVYQPQVDVDSFGVVGLEALVRWRHPTRGEVGPDEFIPAAEINGLIVPLGDYVLRQACRQIRHWIDAGVTPPCVGVNLSGVQFKTPIRLETSLAAHLAEFHVPASLIELELTESVLMVASREHNDALVRLRQAGHRIAIDDFGTGYSSLDYLRRYPVDRIKIAQNFVGDIGKVAGADAIVRAAIGLARELSIEVVVEGVETAGQLELLRGWGARIVQGFYFARPLPVDEAAALMRRGTIIHVDEKPVSDRPQ